MESVIPAILDHIWLSFLGRRAIVIRTVINQLGVRWKGANFCAFSTYLASPVNTRRHGTSRPLCTRSLEYLLQPVICSQWFGPYAKISLCKNIPYAKISLCKNILCKNIEHTVEIVLGTWPTTAKSLIYCYSITI